MLQEIIENAKPRNTNLIQVGQLLIAPGRATIRENQTVELVWIDKDKFGILGGGFNEVTWSILKPGIIEVIDLPRICGRNIVQEEDLLLSTKTDRQKRIALGLDLVSTVKCDILPNGSCWIKNPLLFLDVDSDAAIYYAIAVELFKTDCLIPAVAFTNPSTLKTLTALDLSMSDKDILSFKPRPPELIKIDKMLGAKTKSLNACIVTPEKTYWFPCNSIDGGVNDLIEPFKLQSFLESCGVDSDTAKVWSSPSKGINYDL